MNIEEKIRKIGIGINNMAIRAMLEGFKELYPEYGDKIAEKPTDLEGVAIYLLKMGDYIARGYLEGKKTAGEFDHSRVWYEFPVYTAISHEMGFEVDQKDIFSEASLLASEKFLMEERINEFLYKKE